MNLPDIRQRLSELLDTVPGVRCYDTLPPSVEPPAVLIAVGSGDYDADTDGGVTVEWVVMVVVSRADEDRAQRMLDLYLSTGTNESIADALYADPTLDGTVDSLRLVGWDEPGSVTFANVDYVAVNLRVETVGE